MFILYLIGNKRKIRVISIWRSICFIISYLEFTLLRVSELRSCSETWCGPVFLYLLTTLVFSLKIFHSEGDKWSIHVTQSKHCSVLLGANDPISRLQWPSFPNALAIWSSVLFLTYPWACLNEFKNVIFSCHKHQQG